jgi:hypothetical protein
MLKAEFCEVILMSARGLIFVLLLSVHGLSPRLCGQDSVSAQMGQIPRAPQDDSIEDEAHRKFERDQQKKANEDRFRKLKEDTDKLVELSNELKVYVAKANEHTLSLDVIKKAEEIERLAKSVKDKMKAN